MKNSFKLIALVLAASYPLVALAAVAGVPVPASLNAENLLGLYVATLIGLTAFWDYSRPRRTLNLTPATVAFCPPKSSEPHCLAA